MGLIPLLLAVGATNAVVGVQFNNKLFDEGNVSPKIMGYDAHNVLMLGGLALAFTGIPLLAVAGITAASGAYVAKNTTAHSIATLQQIVKQQVDAQLKTQPQLQLPGGAPVPGGNAADYQAAQNWSPGQPPVAPAPQAPQAPGGFMQMLFGPQQPAQA